MKTKLLVYLVVTTIIFILIITSCEKENSETNHPPECNISYPNNNQIIDLGETITIEVNANDEGGNIVFVDVLIDDIVKTSLTIEPYTFIWTTSNEDLGSHTIEAICGDSDGVKISDNITVTITDDTIHNMLQSDFSTNTTCGTAPTIIYFTDQSINNPVTWYWSFGDGFNSTHQNPSHAYTTDGYYTVTLIVKNDTGSDTTSKNKLIYIGNTIDGTPCPDSPTIMDIDSNIYNTVFIGGQCWMKENLRVGSFINGNIEMSDNGEIERYCYNDNSAFCGIYGALYQWDEMMQYNNSEGAKGICVDGWHIPTDEDWKQLEMYLGMTYEDVNLIGYRGSNEGDKLKLNSGWDNNGNGSNQSNFSAIPGGYYYANDGGFRFFRSDGSWWSSSKYNNDRVWRRGLYSNTPMIRRNHHTKKDGLSVRCIKN